MSVATDMVNGATALGYTSGVLGYGIPGVGWGSSGGAGCGYGGYGGWGCGGGFPMFQNQVTQQNQFLETMHLDSELYAARVAEDMQFLNANNVTYQQSGITQRAIFAESQQVMNRQSDQTSRLERDIFEARLDAAKCCAETKLQMAQGNAALSAQIAAQHNAQQLQVANVDQNVNVNHVDINAHIAQASAAGLLANQVSRDQIVSSVNRGVSDLSALILASAVLSQPQIIRPRPL